MAQLNEPIRRLPLGDGASARADDNLFPGGELPPPDTARRRRAIQIAASVALLASIVYVTWRAAFTLGALWVAIPLWLLELHAALGLALYAASLWDVDRSAIPDPVEHTKLRVGVLIPTYNEPMEILFPTIAAAVALSPEHETFVLDDGHRPWVRELAASLGAGYITREERVHAKAGNLNHALGKLEFDVVGILDADHVVRAGFLTHTLGYFDDERLAVVQTPQDFYNMDSFEHGRNRSWFWRQRRAVAFNEQRLFYRAVQPGKNRCDAALWCGTNAVVRVSALREVGGVATESVTEDMHTTIRLHRRRWRTVYHNEVLAHGLAARDASEYQTQRLRWGTGAMQILRLEKPLTRPGLSLGQRVAYAATLLGWFDAWRTLGYVLVPLAVLFSGATPILAAPAIFIPAFCATFGLQRLALALLSRGYAPQGMATMFEFVRLESNIRATLALRSRRERPFKVTAKDGSDERRRMPAPRLLVTLVVLSAIALVWFACTAAGLTPLTYHVFWTAYGAAFWAVVNLGCLTAALLRIRADRFASERRGSVRLEVGAPARVGGRGGQLVDVSMGGAMVLCEIPPEPRSEPVKIVIDLAGSKIALFGHERGRQTLSEGSALIRLQFLPGQVPELARLATALFGSGEAEAAVREAISLAA